MTYKELAEKILALSDERQQDDVSILLMNTNEVFGIMDFVTNWEDEDADTLTGQACGIDQVAGVLPENNPYMTVDF